jgi:hypothetical protein
MVEPFTMTLSFTDDFVIPEVTSTSPSDGAVGVTPDSPKLVVNVDRPVITPAGYQASFDLQTRDGTPVTGGYFIYAYYTPTLTYNAPKLAANTTYVITLKQRYAPSGVAPKEETFSWTFTTGQ